MKSFLSRVLLAVLIFSTVSIATVAFATTQYESDETIGVRRTLPAVVHIGVLREPETIPNTVGAGVIITSRRGVTYVLTVKHNLMSGDHLFIKTVEGVPYKAMYFIADAHRDLAILRVDTGKDVLAVAQVGNSDELELGQSVIAIGFPAVSSIDGEVPTVSRGIVSGLNRTTSGVLDSESQPDEKTNHTLSWNLENATPRKKAKIDISMTPMIQTDAMVNHGSSGGPLITEDGRVVGVIRSMLTDTGSNAGVNFVIPVKEADLLLAIAGVKETRE